MIFIICLTLLVILKYTFLVLVPVSATLLDQDAPDSVYLEKLLNIFSASTLCGVPPEPTWICENVYIGTQFNAENMTMLKRLRFNCSSVQVHYLLSFTVTICVIKSTYSRCDAPQHCFWASGKALETFLMTFEPKRPRHSDSCTYVSSILIGLKGCGHRSLIGKVAM